MNLGFWFGYGPRNSMPVLLEILPASSITALTLPGVVTLEQFGAKGDGITNDLVAYRAALAVLAASSVQGLGYKTILLGANRTYLLHGDGLGGALGVTPAGCTIFGWGDNSI